MIGSMRRQKESLFIKGQQCQSYESSGLSILTKRLSQKSLKDWADEISSALFVVLKIDYFEV